MDSTFNKSFSEHLVIILNGVTDILDVMEEFLKSEGFQIKTALITDFKRGKINFNEYIKQLKPSVLIYDIPLPYDENLHYLNSLLESGDFDPNCVIISTTNLIQLEKITGEKNAIEIVGKPYDLDILLNKIKDKVLCCGQ